MDNYKNIHTIFSKAKRVIIKKVKGKLTPIWIKIYYKDGTKELIEFKKKGKGEV